MPERSLLAPAVALVAAVTGLRLVLLAFNRTDLFVDEAQYWLWGQEFAFGYYSKPPLIAWVIGGVTNVMGDTPYWVRAPGAVFHGAAGLILGLVARSHFGDRTALWVVAAYLTLPMVAVGSLLASTDTIMAPFFCAALYFHRRMVLGGGPGFAALAGAAAGFAFLAKYAAIYFLIGAGLMALMVPLSRTDWRDALAMLAAFGVVVAPNILWNLNNDLATVSHTMDNAGWLREAEPLGGLNPLDGLAFLASQFAVMGPVLFAGLLWGARRRMAGLWCFVWPPLGVVTAQAVLDKAYANWAAAAFFAGTLIAVAVLYRTPRVLAAGVAINAAVCLALPLLTIAPHLTFGRDAPVLERYLGRADLSRQIIAGAGGLPVVSDRRDVLADLFFTGSGTKVEVYALPPEGRAMNHYAQRHPMPGTMSGPVLFVSATAPLCGGVRTSPSLPLDADGGAYAGEGLAGYRVDAACLREQAQGEASR